MTTREAFLRCMKFQPVQRVPNFELGFWGQTIERWLGEGMTQEATRYATFYGNEVFGLDRRDYVPVNLGPIPAFEHEVIEETERHILFRDGDGALRKAMKDGTVRGTRPSMDQFISFAVETPEDFQRLKQRFDPANPFRYPIYWQDLCRAYDTRQYPLCAVPNAALGLYSNCRRWMGTEGLSVAFYDQPDLVHEMMDFVADFCLAVMERVLADVQVDSFNWFEDFAYKTGPLYSPDIFRRFMLPRYQRVNEFLKAQGVPIITLDSDGNFEVVLPLIIEAGIDCVWPLEVAAGNDPVRLQAEFGNALSLSGGIDKRELAKDRRAIETELRRLAPVVEQGGYIPTVDHTVPPDVPYDNFLYYLELKEKLLTGTL